ncbi:MAG: hypothetical protein JWQ71_3242 [Pedosphaera sp.]|nr:hypothetical protein [Pedosphaera sp.]
MKAMRPFFLATLIHLAILSLASAQPTVFTLNPLTSFGSRGDGSIQPGDSIGVNPATGNNVAISAPGGYGIQPGDSGAAPVSTNGFNMRGLSYDPVSGNLIFVDTHSGSGGSGILATNAAIYILDPVSGQIIGGLTTTGITGGSYTHVVPGVGDDGMIYICNQTTASQTTGFKIYRWPTADINNPDFSAAPTLAYSNIIGATLGTSGERLGETMDVRGAGTNTQIIVGSSSLNGTGTNVFLFTTTDATNFTPHRISFPGVITSAVFNDGIAFGPGNTFWAKQVGKPLFYLGYDPITFAGTVISSFSASSVNDPLLNIAAIAIDPVNHLLAGLEEIGGTATGGRGKVWLFDIANPTNRAPAILASRTFIPNFQKTTAPMGYLRFGNGRLYAHASNNGFLVSSVDSVTASLPVFVTDLPVTTRASVGQTVHFEVFATPGVTNYQWYTNNVPLAGATKYFIDVPNVQTNASGTIYKVVASNPAGSVSSLESTLRIISVADFFHLNLLWSKVATGTPLTDATNYVTSSGGSGTPNERTIAYNPLANQLLVVRGPAAFGSLRIFVVDPDTGNFLYNLNTNGITSSGALTLVGIGVADDGAVYAASVNSASATDQSFKVYRWADTGSNTVPQVIFGTNSSAANGNPIGDLVGSQFYRFGDNLAVHGAGNNTEIILDSQNSTKFVAILRPVPDGTLTNWTQTGYLLQNIQGSYGSEAYGTTIGRSLQFGNSSTFWQKRFNAAAGAPLTEMSYNPGGGLAPLTVANTTAGLFTNGPVGISLPLNLMAAINFIGAAGSDSATSADTLDYYDITDPAQAVLLSRQSLPGANSGNHKANANAIGQVVFGANPVTGTNYVFVLDGNNGIAAYALAGGSYPPPKLLAQPRNLRVLQGGSGSLAVQVDQPVTIEWFKGTNSPVDTGIRGISYNFASALATDAGDYFAVATNVNGSVTSQVAHVSISLASEHYSLSPAWAATAGNAAFPYVTADGGANTPNERSFAYNAISNQLIVVRCPPGSTAYTVWVVDANTGSNLYTLNTTGIVHEGPSEVSGANPIDLVAAAVASDGAVYISNESPNASGGQFGDASKMLQVYRWADSGPATTPALVYAGDPSGAPAGFNNRWGDVLAARGSGTNTELILNSFDGLYAAVLRPTDESLAVFTNYWFYDSAGGGSIGRSIQFGTNNTVLEKRKGAALVYSSYNLTNQTSSSFLSIDSPITLGGVFVDTSRNLVAGVDFVGSTTVPLKPDAVALYDITDPSSPMLLARYNFAANQAANANVISQTVIAGSKIYSLDANNGLLAFNINPPANSLTLSIARLGSNVNVSWGNPNAILQATPGLSPAIWADVTIVGQTNFLQSITNGSQLYRLIIRQ